VHVAAPASAALGCNVSRAQVVQVGELLACVGVEQLCAYRYANRQGFAACAVLVFAAAVLARVGAQHAPVSQVEKGAQPFICLKDYIAAVAAITSGRASERLVFLATHRDGTVASTTGNYFYADLVDELHGGFLLGAGELCKPVAAWR